MAKESLEMAQDYERAVMTGLVSAVATQYYTLLMLDEQMGYTSRSLRAEVNISKSKMKQAELTLIHSLLNAGAEINDALSLFASATIKNQLRLKQIESLSAQTSYSSDRLEKVTAVINLYRALGGGY